MILQMNLRTLMMLRLHLLLRLLSPLLLPIHFRALSLLLNFGIMRRPLLPNEQVIAAMMDLNLKPSSKIFLSVEFRVPQLVRKFATLIVLVYFSIVLTLHAAMLGLAGVLVTS
jgi:hypothetical protein